MLDGNGYQGWGFQQPHIVTITRNTLTYPGCGGATFTFRYTAEGRMQIDKAEVRSSCGLDELGTMLVRVLRSGPLVERVAGGGIAFTSGDEIINLRSEKQVKDEDKALRERVDLSPPPAYISTPPRPPAAQATR